jgi:ferredoxin--NADP+ reductase
LTTPRRRTPPRPKLAETTILKRTDITEDLWLVWMEKPEGFTFKPGQYCTLGVNGIERAYSISSAPYEEDLELFVELVPPPDGNLTPLLNELNVGDKLTIRPRAKGLFVFKPDFKRHLFVSTVTGVVPYISILRQYLHDNTEGHEIYLLLGASYEDELTYDSEIQKIADERPDLLKFVPTVSRPTEERNASWTGETGRVNNVVEKYIDEWNLSADDTLIYACGHPGMIEDVKDRFIPKSFSVEEERFWKDD